MLIYVHTSPERSLRISLLHRALTYLWPQLIDSFDLISFRVRLKTNVYELQIPDVRQPSGKGDGQKSRKLNVRVDRQNPSTFRERNALFTIGLPTVVLVPKTQETKTNLKEILKKEAAFTIAAVRETNMTANAARVGGTPRK